MQTLFGHAVRKKKLVFLEHSGAVSVAVHAGPVGPQTGAIVRVLPRGVEMQGQPLKIVCLLELHHARKRRKKDG